MSTSLTDVMQVCRNGHVITDLLRACPEHARSHCDRCGAPTFDRCLTCGEPLAGARLVPGLVPVGTRPPPSCCPRCGAAFPWSQRPIRPPATGFLLTLETMLRRLPRTIRALRTRHGDRPPFGVADERDLEDLLRAVLPLHAEEIRLDCRTPSYAQGTQTHFLLPAHRIAITGKYVDGSRHEDDIAAQLCEDVAYHCQRWEGGTLLALVCDLEGRLPEPQRLEAAWSHLGEGMDLRCVVAY